MGPRPLFIPLPEAGCAPVPLLKKQGASNPPLVSRPCIDITTRSAGGPPSAATPANAVRLCPRTLPEEQGAGAILSGGLRLEMRLAQHERGAVLAPVRHAAPLLRQAAHQLLAVRGAGGHEHAVLPGRLRARRAAREAQGGRRLITLWPRCTTLLYDRRYNTSYNVIGIPRYSSRHPHSLSFNYEN